MVTLPGWFSYWYAPSRLDGFIEAVCKSKTVEVVSVAGQSYYHDWIDRLAKVESIKKIIIRSGNGSASTAFNAAVKANPRLTKLVHWIP